MRFTRMLGLAVIGFATVTLAACSGKPYEGKWQYKEVKGPVPDRTVQKIADEFEGKTLTFSKKEFVIKGESKSDTDKMEVSKIDHFKDQNKYVFHIKQDNDAIVKVLENGNLALVNPNREDFQIVLEPAGS